MKLHTKTRLTALAVSAGLALFAGTANAALVLVDNFNGYSTGTVSGGSNAFTANSGPWQAWNGTGTTGGNLIGISAGTNKHLFYGWGSGNRGAYLNTIPTTGNTQEGAYYFQARRTAANGTVSYGLTDATAPTSLFTDFNVVVSLETSGSTFNLTAQNGATTATLATGLTTNVWYDIWLVADNATDTFDVYFGTTGDPNTLGTQVGNDLAFGNATSNSLVTFATLNTIGITNTSAQLDNLSAEIVPEPSSLALLGLGGLLIARRRRS